MQLKETTLQNYEPEPLAAPAFPSNSPREGVDNVRTHGDSATRSCPSDMKIDPEACRQAKMSLRELRLGNTSRPETAQLIYLPTKPPSSVKIRLLDRGKIKLSSLQRNDHLHITQQQTKFRSSK